jgi:hypothetical protein
VTYRELKQIAGRKPFRPFEIRMDDGRKFQFKERVGFLLTWDEIVTVDGGGYATYLPFASMAKAVYLDEIVEVY